MVYFTSGLKFIACYLGANGYSPAVFIVMSKKGEPLIPTLLCRLVTVLQGSVCCANRPLRPGKQQRLKYKIKKKKAQTLIIDVVLAAKASGMAVLHFKLNVGEKDEIVISCS